MVGQVPSPSLLWSFLRSTSRFALLVWLLLASGCMHRRMTIRSDPPGALVLVDGEEIGTTPVGYDYTYYGTRNITLIKDGYQTLTTPVTLNPPWYQVPPLDFFSDNFAMRKINDWREQTFTLQPEMLVPTEQLRDRANSFRSDATRTDYVTPYGGVP